MKNTSIELDKTDLKILKILQSEGRLPVVELAKRIHLTTTPCAERLKRLERRGIINGYKANLDAEKLGLEMCVFIQLRLDQSSPSEVSIFKQFAQVVKGIPEIEESYLLTGGFDALIKVRVANMSAYRNFMTKRLIKLPGIIQSQSQVVTEEIKSATGPNPELITS